MVFTKEQLKQRFSKEYKKHYHVNLFSEKGFVRKQCVKCGKYFWTLNPDVELCGDPPCVKYSFIDNPATSKPYSYHGMWKKFSKFFKDTKPKHTEIKRYPVVARWREDLFFTIASISNFQPFVVSGEVEPPANPLVVPQMCLRFGDTSNVGITGRHLTSFIMGGQHAFNSEDKEVYWKDECLDMNFEFLTSKLGIPKEEITAVESVWSGGGNFGPCVEYLCRGLEITNQVFMQYRETDSGFETLPTKVVDVGWGHARLVWISRGNPTTYEGVFGPVIERMKKESGFLDQIDFDIYNKFIPYSSSLDIESIDSIKKEKEKIAKELNYPFNKLDKTVDYLQALYSIADHARTLTFAIADGALPSNVGGGYNLRVVLRRAFSFLKKYRIPYSLHNVVDWLIDDLKPWFVELDEERDQIHKILEVELDRAEGSNSRSNNIVKELLKNEIKKSKDNSIKLSNKELIKLYESQGVTPDQINEIAKSLKFEIIIPKDAYLSLTKRNEMGKIHRKEDSQNEKDMDKELKGFTPTKTIFYEDMYQSEFKAEVLATGKSREGIWILLDQTCFYPEGGGQPSDIGTIEDIKIKTTRRVGKHILHYSKEKNISLKKNQKVVGKIDWERRFAFMQHHTGTHVLLAACRKTLGNHVWQWGSQLDLNKGRLDISHYQQLTREELDKIEFLVNETIQKNISVKATWLPRREAEDKYGARLYQGGVVPGKIIRVIETKGIDYEACGGTHLHSTGEIGLLVITRSKRVQDGIVRLEFKCGKAAVKELQKIRGLLNKAATEINTDSSKLTESIKKIIKENKNLKKRIEKSITSNVATLIPKVININGQAINFYLEIDSEEPMKELLLKADNISKTDPSSFVLIVNQMKKPIFALAIGKELTIDPLEVANKISNKLGGGSGRVDKHLAQGGGKSNEKLSSIIKDIEKILE
ncbi:MAG: alanine--tRNA ligase [Candidatus Ranarchaeia archaeon]